MVGRIITIRTCECGCDTGYIIEGNPTLAECEYCAHLCDVVDSTTRLSRYEQYISDRKKQDEDKARAEYESDLWVRKNCTY